MSGRAALALAIALAAPAGATITRFVDGACPSSGDGTTLTCGATGPFKTLNEGLRALRAQQQLDALVLNVRAGRYAEYLKVWGDQAITCTFTKPCVIQGCPAAVCGTDETFTVTGFVEPPPESGWSISGTGANAVYARPVASRGEATEFAGTGNQPEDAYYGSGAGPFNPMYLLEGAQQQPMGYGGSCAGDFATLCGSDSFCPGGQTCDRTKPPDGKWGLQCTGSPVTSCTIYVNPVGTNDPTAGYDIWIPDRNANGAIDGRTGCPERYTHGCPPTNYLTLRRAAFEGARWTGLNIQYQDKPGHGLGLVLEDVTVRHAPRYGIRTQNLRAPVFDGLLIEHMARGLSFHPEGDFGLRLFGWRGGILRNITGRHLCASGKTDGNQDGVPDASARTCDVCESPFHTTTWTAWAGSCQAWDLKQSEQVLVEDLTAFDVSGGARLDTVNDILAQRLHFERTRNGLTINQLTPQPRLNKNRTYNVTVRDSTWIDNGISAAPVLSTTSGVGSGSGDQCITPLGPGEHLRLYNNLFVRNAPGAINVCYNRQVCAGGKRDGQKCTTVGSTAECSVTSAGVTSVGTCVATDGGVGEVLIAHNTIYQDLTAPPSEASGITLMDQSSQHLFPRLRGVSVRGNLVIGVGQDALYVPYETAADQSFDYDGNVYYNLDGDRDCLVRVGRADGSTACYTTLAQVQAGFPGRGAHEVDADPMVVNLGALNFRLTAASPALARIPGLAATALDRDGHFRPFGTLADAGAYEFPGRIPIWGTSISGGGTP